MSQPTASPVAAASPDGQSAPAPRFWPRLWTAIEGLLTKLADRSNAIVVKETRQALKSRQFVISFLIVLLASWVATIGGVAMIGPQIYYAAAGAEMLVAYFCILAFPLFVVVPFTAFRSIAIEREDNTYDLLSITTLTARRIITGKLLSAALQTLVFLSAVSPCIAFTYLLRGVDARTVAVVLGLAVVESLGLAMLGLLAGSATRVRYSQNILSVGLIVGLLAVLAGSIGLVVNLIYYGYQLYRDAEFYWVAGGLGLLYVTTFGLLHAAAAAQIAFQSENRSTPVRWWMMAQTGCLVGWLAAEPFVLENSGPTARDLVLIGAMLAGLYWFAMGAFVSSEWPLLSVRVQRSLPQSTLGRAVLTWFNPGPGTGFMFVVANVTGLLALGMAVLVAQPTTAPTWISASTAMYFCLLAWGYIVAYLGVGRLVVGAFRRIAFVPLTGGFLIQVILVLIGLGAPICVQMASTRMRYSGSYSLMHLSNPFWTLYELVDKGASSIDAATAAIVVSAVAVAALMLNFRSVAAEIVRHRLALPARVIEEEAELHPEPAPRPTNPWELEAAQSQESGSEHSENPSTGEQHG